MEDQLKGKVVAITGASSGIGKAIAEKLATMGCKVVLGARRKDELKQVSDTIHNGDGQAVYSVVDVSKKADLTELVALAVSTYGKLDVMINNAGVTQLSRIDALDIDGWDEMIDINLKGVLYGMAAAIAVFQEQKSGHIVNIISTSGIKISPSMGVYAATKNAVRTLSEAFRQESDGRIRITGISPGFVRTNLSDNIKNQQIKNVIQDQMEKLALPPEAIADAVIYAMSQPKGVEIGDIVIRPAAQD
jgi:NADP-dependent 3-hydroxy acid dehydrogenase YdfG